MPGRYQFSLPERPARDGWFRVGTIDVTTTALLVGLGVISMFVYAADKATAVKLAYYGPFVRDGDVWRVVTWPLFNPPDSIWVILTFVFFWFVGHRIEDHIGRKHFTILIAAMTVIPAAITTAFDLTNDTALGYGLGILGIGLLVIFALDNPNAVFFFGIPAWVIAAVYVLIDILRYVGDRMWGVVVLELLVIAVGLIGARQYGMVDVISFVPKVGKGRKHRAPRAKRPRTKGPSAVVAGPWTGASASNAGAADQAELDLLLDKINLVGVNGLTNTEKQRLTELSARLRNRGV